GDLEVAQGHPPRPEPGGPARPGGGKVRHGARPGTGQGAGPGGERDGVGKEGNLAGGDGDHEPVQVDPGGGRPGAQHRPATLTGEPFQDRGGDQVGGESGHEPSVQEVAARARVAATNASMGGSTSPAPTWPTPGSL